MLSTTGDLGPVPKSFHKNMNTPPLRELLSPPQTGFRRAGMFFFNRSFQSGGQGGAPRHAASLWGREGVTLAIQQIVKASDEVLPGRN
jgi:hypothetical protein